MIKAKLLLPLSFIAFAFFILIFSALQSTQTQTIQSSSISFSSANSKKIYEASFSATPPNCILAYPGILPNHPFYFLKMIRDKVKLTLTRNPQKKLNLILLYSDKRLVSGEILILEGDIGLGVSTITKAEKYLQKAGLFTVQNLIKNENKDLFQKTVDTYLTHRQRVENLLISEISPDQKQVLQDLQTQSNYIFEDKFADYLKDKNSSPSASLSE